LARSRIFDFPGKYEVTYVTVYNQRQYHFFAYMCLWHGLAPASAVVMVELGNHFECRKKALSGFLNWKCLNWCRCVFIIIVMVEEVIRTSYFAGKSEVWLVTVIFGNAEVHTTVMVFSRFRRMERTICLAKENCVG